jgi:uncharacterized protein (TIGR03435 family)
MPRRQLVQFLTAALLFAVPAVPQPPSATDVQDPHATFDVATIRPSDDKDDNRFFIPLAGGNGYSVHRQDVRAMIALMHRVPTRQISGGPEWLGSALWDIEAKTLAEQPYTLDELHIRFNNLLAERFHLKFHIEQREGPVYLLTIDKSGLKMKPNPAPEGHKILMTCSGGGTCHGNHIPMDYLCWFLGGELEAGKRPVLDRTGLTGAYDFDLTYAPDTPADNLPADARDHPGIRDAVREQLGLHLEAGRGPIDYYVIDHIERPSEN